MHAFHNHVQLVGRCGHEPELKVLTDGTHHLQLRLYQDSRAEGYPPNSFRIKAWKGVARAMHRQIGRGDRLLVQGKLVNRSWEQLGQTVSRTEIHVSYFSVLANRGPHNEGRELPFSDLITG